MSNTAKQFQSLDPTATDGLDSLFEVQAQPSPEQVQSNPSIDAQPGPDETHGDPIIAAQPDLKEEGIPLSEAAKLLDLHIDTVRKRLQKGKLRGFKVAEKYGKKWFVCASELSNLQCQIRTDSGPIHNDPSNKAQGSPDETHGDPIIAAQAGPTQIQDDPSIKIQPNPSDLLDALKSKDAVIENQAHQLKAAGDVIMYMSSQLEEQKEQLKLLTDSQQQPSKWQKFAKWFLLGSLFERSNLK